MKEIKLPSGTYLFVEAPDDAYDFNNKRHSSQIEYTINIHYKNTCLKCIDAIILIDYYNDNFQIISTTIDITEEQAKSLVEKPEYGWYLTYTRGNMDSYHCKTAKESLISLIENLELDVNKNYLILQKHEI